MLSNGTVAICAFGGCTKAYCVQFSTVSGPSFFHWNSRPAAVLLSGRPPAGAVLRARPHVSASLSPAGQTSEEMGQLKEKVERLTASNKQLLAELNHADKENDDFLEQLMQERARADDATTVAEANIQHEVEARLMQERARGVAEVNRQHEIEIEAVRRQINEEKQEKQALQHEVDRLRRETSHQQTQLYYKQRAIDTQRNEERERQREIEQLRQERATAAENTEQLQRQVDNVRESCRGLRQQLHQFLSMFAIPLDEVKIDMKRKKLGGGSYGGVHLALWHGVSVAVKQFYQVLMRDHTRRLCEQELSVCCSIRHSNIVRVHGYAMVEDRPLHIVMELLEGSLEDLIAAARKSGHYLNEREQVDVATGTVSGINHLHGLSPRPYIHGDVKMGNVMVSRNMTAKVGDLGASHMLDGSLSAGPLSPNYMAPERDVEGQAHSTLASDVFSLGVTLCEIFTGEAAVRAQRHDQLDAIMDAQLQDVCLQMCSVDVGKRPRSSHVLAILSERQNGGGYQRCPPRRNVIGKSQGDEVYLVDRLD